MSLDLPKLSIVVIGRNEASNLDKCFAGIANSTYPSKLYEIIYVDTGSKDRSISIATNYTNNIYSVNSKWPTAGLARNKGLEVSKHDIIQFIDGDIEIEANYLTIAVTFLLRNAHISAVTGYYKERSNNFWNKVLGYRRLDGSITKEGYITNTSGGGLYWKRVLLEVNGYDERIKKGQETELGERLKQKGYKIWFMNILQGTHNFDIDTVWQLMHRHYVNGLSIGHLMFLSYKNKENKSFLTSRKIGIKSLTVNLSVIFLLIAFILLNNPLISLSILILYNFYILVQVLYHNKNKNIKYIFYRLTMSYGSFHTFVGIFSITIKIFLNTKFRKIVLKPKDVIIATNKISESLLCQNK